jgi:hypothetical protein
MACLIVEWRRCCQCEPKTKTKKTWHISNQRFFFRVSSPHTHTHTHNTAASAIAVVSCNATASPVLRALFSPQLPSLILIDLASFHRNATADSDDDDDDDGANSQDGTSSNADPEIKLATEVLSSSLTYMAIGSFARSPVMIAWRARRAAHWLGRRRNRLAVIPWPPR